MLKLKFKNPNGYYVDYHLASASFITSTYLGFYYGGVMNLDRLKSLVGDENLIKIVNLNILIVGIGGVGGYTFESLVRTGVNNITVIDHDIIDETNLNRQILTDTTNIGKLKVDASRERALKINPSINLKTANIFLDKDTIEDIDFTEYDYVIDACDTLTTKALLINECLNNNVKIISSMGTAKKMNALKLDITTLNKTSYDPLAKKLRGLIDKDKQNKVVVISSTEEPKKLETLGSNSFVPGVAGLLITNYIINDICKEK